MSDKSIIDLTTEEICEMDLKDLALIFVSDFHQHQIRNEKQTLNISEFIREQSLSGWNVNSIMSEVVQWLCNNKYIAKNFLSKDPCYFITRSGKKWMGI